MLKTPFHCFVPQHVSDERIYKEFHQNTIQLLKAETKRILKTYEDKSVYLSEQDIFDYVQNVKRILEIFEIRDREIIQTLLSLLEKVSGKVQPISERDIKRRRRRRKRQTNVSTENPVVNLAIGVLALLPPDITRTKEELRWMCRYTEHSDEKNMTEYHTIKFNKTHDFRGDTFRVPNVGLEWMSSIKLNNLYDLDAQMEYCVGSAYDKTYPYPMYQLYVFDSSDSKNFHFVQSKIHEETAVGQTLEISIHLNDTIKPENAICEMLIDDTWQESVCKKGDQTVPKTLVCVCTRNNPFRITFVNAKVEKTDTLTPASVTKTMTVATKPTIEVTKAKEQEVATTQTPIINEDEPSGSTCKFFSVTFWIKIN